MTRTIVLLFLLCALLVGQTAPTGVVDVAVSITATAGTLVCTGTPTVGATVSVMVMTCKDGAAEVLPSTSFKVTAPGDTVYSVGRNGNTITWLLSKGNPTPDRWEVAANGVSKSGTF